MTNTKIIWTVNRNVNINGRWFHLVEINDGRQFINGYQVTGAKWREALNRAA